MFYQSSRMVILKNLNLLSLLPMKHPKRKNEVVALVNAVFSSAILFLIGGKVFHSNDLKTIGAFEKKIKLVPLLKRHSMFFVVVIAMVFSFEGRLYAQDTAKVVPDG